MCQMFYPNGKYCFSLSGETEQINIVTHFRGKTRRFRVGGQKRGTVWGGSREMGSFSVVYGAVYAPVSVAG